MKFEEIVEELPKVLEKLSDAKRYPIRIMTQGYINKNILGTEIPVAGVYVMSYQKTGQPVYVGRSRHLSQRIGVDHRAIQKAQASLAYKLTKIVELPQIQTIEEARDYMYENFEVGIVKIEDVHLRTIFEVYAAMKLQTEYNSFRES